eukprot:2999845-Pyramimonas_sp.AAC.1
MATSAAEFSMVTGKDKICSCSSFWNLQKSGSTTSPKVARAARIMAAVAAELHDAIRGPPQSRSRRSRAR